MSEVKWIKIVTDIFDDEKMCLIESLPSADSIIVIWFKLLCLAGKNNNSGVFLMNDRIAYTDEMLATVFRRDVNTVRLALDTFERFGMIEIIDGVITIPNWNKHQTLDSYEKRKERDRVYQAERRAKQKALVQKSTDSSTDASADSSTDCSSDVGFSDIDKDIDKEKDINISSSKEKPKKKKYGEYKHVSLTEDEYNRLVSDYGEQAVLEGIRNVDEYCEEKGKTYKNYNLTLRKWGIKTSPLPKQEVPGIDPEDEARQKAWEEGFHDA